PIMPHGVTELYQKVMEAGNIQDVMSVANFLNPVDEDDNGEDEQNVGEDEVLQEVLQEHLGLPTTQSDEEDDDQLPQPMYSMADAKQALHILIGFAESQESLSSDYLRTLEWLESAIEGIQQASLVQGTLDTWIT
ncbi:hypothetical protein GMDG_08831, partial [Pseudogymnoascus destructans 20631-21]